jgi:hypothetical protein
VNLVILSSEITHQMYLINEIHRHHPVAKVFLQDLQTEKSSLGVKLRKLKKWRNIRYYVNSKLTERLFRSADDLEHDYEARMFFGDDPIALDSAIPVERVSSFNTPEGVEAVRSAQPDLIVVFGTSILRGEILRLARMDILNIHRSILPDYRGGGLPFWVFYNKDFENLGVTIHVCSDKLDGGDIVALERYRLRDDDGIHTLRYKTTLLAIEMLKGVIDQYRDGTVVYRPQQPSRLWTSRGLSAWKEYVARRNLGEHIDSLRAGRRQG